MYFSFYCGGELIGRIKCDMLLSFTLSSSRPEIKSEGSVGTCQNKDTSQQNQLVKLKALGRVARVCRARLWCGYSLYTLSE